MPPLSEQRGDLAVAQRFADHAGNLVHVDSRFNAMKNSSKKRVLF